jgi:hypothetical protein
MSVYACRDHLCNKNILKATAQNPKVLVQFEFIESLVIDSDGANLLKASKEHNGSWE